MRLLVLAAALALAGPSRAQPPATAKPDAAQIDLARGLALDLGTTGHPDAPAAFTLYLRAAQQNLPDAEFNVAVMYDSGRGTARDAASAARWYAAAAAGGVSRAAYNLGQLYEHGDGVPADARTARAWYRRAAGEGLAAARSRLRDRMVRAPDQQNAADAGQQAAQPVWPRDGAVLPVSSRPTALIWLPDAGRRNGRGHLSYFVEVVALSHGLSNIVFEGTTNVTAILADAVWPAGDYAWRVFTIQEAPARYVQSGWARFSVGR